MTFHYDSDRGLLRTALSLHGTVIPKVLSSKAFWAFFAFHMIVWLSFRFGLMGREELDPAADFGLDWKFVGVITSITTFFEVFYSQQCYGRYQALYKTFRGMIEDSFAFAYLMRVHVGDKSPSSVRLSIRYMILSMFLQVFEMKSVESGEDSTGPAGDHELAGLVKFGVLKPRERDALAQVSRKHRAMTALNWAASFALVGAAESKGPNNIFGTLSQKLFLIRSGQQVIIDTLSLPVPFQYFHLLTTMICANLGLWAYSMGLTDSIFAPVVFFFASLIFIGMMELSSDLSDPFGDDEVDFPVDDWLAECVESIVEIIEGSYPGGADGMKLAAAEEVAMPREYREVHFFHEVKTLVQQGVEAGSPPPSTTGPARQASLLY